MPNPVSSTIVESCRLVEEHVLCNILKPPLGTWCPWFYFKPTRYFQGVCFLLGGRGVGWGGGGAYGRGLEVAKFYLCIPVCVGTLEWEKP